MAQKQSEDQNHESAGTILLAGGANLAIAVAKLVGGLISGSSAMLAEAAHSVADTLNQVFLMAALRRSQLPADDRHPFGYGMERYFWSLIAAVGIFVLGAGYSIYEGVHSLLNPEALGGLLVSYIVLAVAFLMEGTSWLKAIRQLGGEADRQDHGFFEHLRITPDPTAKTVAFEDTAALVGIVLAAVGLTLHHFTGQAWWDGAASILIGLLLVTVAYALGQQNKRALVGQSVPRPMQDSIRRTIAQSDGIDSVIDLFTIQLSPEQVLVAAKVDLDDAASPDELEHSATRIEERLREAHPEVTHVFLDPTDDPDEVGEEGPRTAEPGAEESPGEQTRD